MAVALWADCMLDTLSSVMCDGRKLCVNTVGFSRVVVVVGLLKDRFRMIYDCMTLRYLWERQLFSRVFLFARWPFLSRADSPFPHRSRFVRSFVLKLHPRSLSRSRCLLSRSVRTTHDFFSARSKLCPLLMNRFVRVPKLSDFITTWAVGQGETVDSLKLSRERLSGARERECAAHENDIPISFINRISLESSRAFWSE